MTLMPYALTRPVHVAQAHLKVSDIASVSGFYQRAIGLGLLDKSAHGETLGIGHTPLLKLTHDNNSRPAPRQAAGLFHTAFLLPNRLALAQWLRHVVAQGITLEGASDHIVSEAIYLSDPEGNGIEIYADRSPDEWTYDASGFVTMATRRLDLQALYDSAPDSAWQGAPEGTALGHIHLQVGHLPEAERFYSEVLGLKIMARYPGASFFASGDYHHHIAANIWNSRGATPRSDAANGLVDYSLRFNDLSHLNRALDAANVLEIQSERRDGGFYMRDPWGIGLTLLSD